jgi:hypothetical protein
MEYLTRLLAGLGTLFLGGLRTLLLGGLRTRAFGDPGARLLGGPGSRLIGDLVSPSDFSPETMLKQLEAAKQQVKDEQLLPRIPMTFTPPLVLKVNLIAQRMQWDKIQRDRGSYTRQTYLGNEIYFSSTPLSSLKPGKC